MDNQNNGVAAPKMEKKSGHTKKLVHLPDHCGIQKHQAEREVKDVTEEDLSCSNGC